MSDFWMETYSGRKFYPMAPDINDIDFDDVARALSNMCRYNGHIWRFYSVAEHSCNMAQWFMERGSDDFARYALAHDMPEAYLSDLITPIKRETPAYQLAEDRLLAAVHLRLGLHQATTPEAVKHVDAAILLDERAALKPNHQHRWGLDDTHKPLGIKVVGMPPSDAMRWFSQLFDHLFPGVPRQLWC